MDPATITTIASTLGGIGSQLWSLTGPISAAGWMKARADLITDLAVTRGTEYYCNRLTVDRRREGVRGNNLFRGQAYVNLMPQPGELMRAFHQSQWGADGAPSESAWSWLQSLLTNHGIDLAVPGDTTSPTVADAWGHIVRMAATAAPLDSYLLDWRRRGSQAAGNARDRLDFTLQRAGYSDPRDRDLLLRPWHRWGAMDAARLRWFGLASDEQYDALVRSAGMVREDDRAYAEHMARVLPPPAELALWEARHLWSAELANRYGLDRGNEGTPFASFWARAQGLGADQLPLPGQPNGGNDWLRLAYRATKRMPGFAEATMLQWRLRQQPGQPGQSVRPPYLPWSRDDTANMLRLSGHTEPVIEQMMALTETPLSSRTITRILVPSLRTPAIAAQAEQVFGVGVDWIANAYQDAGLPAATAKLVADGQREQADRSVRAEWWEHEKSIRSERRKVTEAEYQAGLLTQQDAIAGMVDEFFDQNQARDTILRIDREVQLAIVTRQLAALKEAWMRGAVPTNTVSQALSNLGIQPARAEQYGLEWNWERTEHVRVLQTGEVLSLLAKGFLTPAAARVRLLNIGWTDADAIMEIAVVERQLAQAAAKVAGVAAAKSASEQTKALKDRQAALLKTQKELAAAAKQEAKTEKANVLAMHEKLMHQSKYYAAVHKSNAAYAKAEAKNDTEKMQAQLETQIADYHNWIIEQVNVATGGTTLGPPTTTIDTQPAPGPKQGDGAGADAAKPESGDGETK